MNTVQTSDRLDTRGCAGSWPGTIFLTQNRPLFPRFERVLTSFNKNRGHCRNPLW